MSTTLVRRRRLLTDDMVKFIMDCHFKGMSRPETVRHFRSAYTDCPAKTSTINYYMAMTAALDKRYPRNTQIVTPPRLQYLMEEHYPHMVK